MLSASLALPPKETNKQTNKQTRISSYYYRNTPGRDSHPHRHYSNPRVSHIYTGEAPHTSSNCEYPTNFPPNRQDSHTSQVLPSLRTHTCMYTYIALLAFRQFGILPSRQKHPRIILFMLFVIVKLPSTSNV